MLKTSLSVATLIIAGLLTSGAANSAPISFTETIVDSGSLDTFAFRDALVTLSGTGDTDDISSPSAGLYETPVQVEVKIGGFPTAYFTDKLILTSNQGYRDIGIGDITTDLALLFDIIPSNSYDLSASFGPVSGSSLLNGDSGFATTGGTLFLATNGPVTYQATVSSASPAPEPSIWMFMIAGVAMVGGFLRIGRKRGVGPLSIAA
jgi:hypothetical protein